MIDYEKSEIMLQSIRALCKRESDGLKEAQAKSHTLTLCINTEKLKKPHYKIYMLQFN